MAFAEWTLDLDTGFNDIDDQHKILLDRINAFADAHESNNRIDTKIALQNLLDYTIEHFRYEEQMLAEAQYHLLEPHKKVHQNFINKIEAARDRYENGDVAAADELLTLLDGWLFRHIRLNDHGYVESVKKSGIR